MADGYHDYACPEGDTALTITTIAPNSPPYVPAMYINKADPKFFGGFTKTDFLWSVAARTANLPKPDTVKTPKKTN